MEQLLPAMKNVQDIERWAADLFGDAEPFGEPFNEGRFPCAKVADEGDDPSGMLKFLMAMIFQGCGVFQKYRAL